MTRLDTYEIPRNNLKIKSEYLSNFDYNTIHNVFVSAMQFNYAASDKYIHYNHDIIEPDNFREQKSDTRPKARNETKFQRMIILFNPFLYGFEYIK